MIPDAERMRTETANAFLKTLEEPPGQTLLLLTTGARDRLPATIVSRCRRMNVRPLPLDALAREIVARGIAEGAEAGELAVTAEGSLGLAEQLAGGEALVLWRWLAEEAFARPGPAAAEALADRLSGYGGAGGDSAGKRKNALQGLDLAALALRRRLREGLSPERGETALAALWTAGERIALNVKPELALLSASFAVMAALRS